MCCLVMNCGMMFCHVVAVVLFAWGPVVSKLSLTFSVAEPMVSHVHCFQFLDNPAGVLFGKFGRTLILLRATSRWGEGLASN